MTGKRCVSTVLLLLSVAVLSGGCNLPERRPAAVVPTVAALPTTTDTPMPTRSMPATWTPTFTWTPSITPSASYTFTPSPTLTITPSDTPTATRTPIPTNTPIPTATVIPIIPPRQPIGFVATAPPGVSGIEARLWALPIIPETPRRARRIFAAGEALGNRPQVFSKVGDCHTAAHAYLLPLGVGEYELGPYSFLQTDIGFFSSVSPRQGVPNSFENQSMAAASAFNTAAVQDYIWADPAHCEQGESPLECEYRLLMPSIAVITLGSVDVQLYGPEDFRIWLEQLVQTTIARGIVPVLTTIPTHLDYFYDQSMAFNGVILDIAQQEQLPLINFWRATRELPNYGLEEDNFHLSHPEDRFISFNGDEHIYGVTLHNLVTMLMLDHLRLNVLSM